ncbi:hypothetical protein [Phenylobacterium aquaticum]|uniref:hypothetical protein n=1 Tax=Phenylobacterium aquaticum TaxID=1763816 RepID=UPI0026EB2806|nr:hypothetical protein [Phenylobacterium aquaticum]
MSELRYGAAAPPIARPRPRIAIPGGWGLLIFSLPVLSGLVNRVVRGGVWFTDYDALVCGAERVRSGVGLYDQAVPCADPNAAAFVYGPWVARLTAGLLGVFGHSGLMALYLALYAGAAALVVWAACLRRETPGAPRDRARFMAVVSGSAVTTGNIALPLHAGVVAAGLVFARAPWLFVLAVAAAGAVKPVFLTYLAVLVLARRSPAWRVGAVALGLGLGLAPTVLFAGGGGPEVAAWRALLSHFVYQVTPGDGLFGWLTLAGVPTEGAPGVALALLWAALMTFCGLVIAERGRLLDEQRLWLGLACAVLANPRLMSEDVFLLGPGLLVAVSAIRPRQPKAALWAGWAVAAACVFSLAGHLLDFADYGSPLGMLALGGVMIACGAASALPRARAA